MGGGKNGGNAAKGQSENERYALKSIKWEKVKTAGIHSSKERLDEPARNRGCKCAVLSVVQEAEQTTVAQTYLVKRQTHCRNALKLPP